MLILIMIPHDRHVILWVLEGLKIERKRQKACPRQLFRIPEFPLCFRVRTLCIQFSISSTIMTERLFFIIL